MVVQPKDQIYMRKRKKKETIQWVTVYLTGISDFRDEVKERMEGSELKFMPGFVETQAAGITHDLYWVDATTNLRQLKEAIGAKLIWKYRLRFFSTLEDFIRSQASAESELTDRERLMILKMSQAEKGFNRPSEAA